MRLVNIARCDANVLILGETGTGKEVCAQAVHYMSARAANAWVAVNCGGIPGELIEDELFGHVRGAYTTAVGTRSGLVREAEGGTLFLDDIDCLPLGAQAKLLRFLQELEYRPVGSNAVIHANVRVVAASNRDLHALSHRGVFRQDLYFRLNVLRLTLPPLRERPEDIALLAGLFLREFAQRHKRPVNRFSAGAVERLLAHAWPGNVRELRHLIERAVLLAPGVELQSSDLEIDGEEQKPVTVDDESFKNAKRRIVRDFERGYIEQLLAASGGNIAEAARCAKKDRRAFFELMRKHRIDAERFRAFPGA